MSQGSRIVLLGLISLGLVSCSKVRSKSKPVYAQNLEALTAKAALYLTSQPDVYDQDGWILTDECDALLHGSLARVGGADIDVFLARDEDGRMWRRPGRDCLSSGGSKSSISRDMLLGYLLVLVFEKRLEDVESLIEYGKDNLWVMGEHDGSADGLSRVLLTPTFQALLLQARKELGGDGSVLERIPQIYSNVDGFMAHLQALSILAAGMIYNGLTDSELERMVELTEQDPNNALFWAIRKKFEDGDQTRAVSILLRDDLFPSDRLPTSADRCVPYLFMHGEKPTDWSSCDEGHTHPGHDLTFVTAIIYADSFGFRAW